MPNNHRIEALEKRCAELEAACRMLATTQQENCDPHDPIHKTAVRIIANGFPIAGNLPSGRRGG